FCCILQVSALALEPTLLDKGYRQMYNLQFSDAHETFAAYSSQNAADPMGAVSDAAAYLFSEFDRLHILQSEFWIEDQSLFDFHKLNADPVVKKRFDEALARTQRLADTELKKSSDSPNAQLASALRLGLQADYTALIEKRAMAALTQVKQSRLIAEK